MADGTVRIDSEIDDKGVRRGIGNIKNALGKLDKKMIKTAAYASAIVLSPSLVPSIASATGLVMGLGSAFASAGIGVAGFGAVSIAVLNDVFEASEEITKAQEELTKATTAEEREKALKKMEEAMMGLSHEQKEALKSLREFKEYWETFITDFDSLVVDSFRLSLDALKQTLELSHPAIEGAGIAIRNLMETFNKKLQTDQIKEIFEYFGSTAQENIERFGRTTGNVMLGFFELMKAFAPLSDDITKGLENMSREFAEWAAGIEESVAFQNFIEYIRTNGPVMLSIIGNVLGVLVALGEALAPLGEALVKVIDDFSGLTEAMLAGDPIGGFVESLKLSIPQLIQTGGEMLLGLVQGFISYLPQLFELATTIITALIEGIIQLAPQFTETFVQLINKIGIILEENGPILLMLGMKLLQTIIDGITQNLPLIIQMGLTLLQKLVNGIVENLPLIIQAAISLIDQLLTALINNLPLIIAMGLQLLDALIQGIKNNLPALLQMAIRLIKSIVDTLIANLPQIIEMGMELLLALIDGIIEMLPELISATMDLIIAITKAIVDNIDKIVEAGVEILLAFVEGIIDALPELYSAINDDVLGGMLELIENVNLFDIGKEIIQGFINGFKSLDIPTPHFSVSGSLDLNPKGGMSMPSVGVDWYAQGGLFPANSPRLIGIGDASVPEAALPLKPSVLGMIGDRIASTMNPGNGSGITQNITITSPQPLTPSIVKKKLTEHQRQLALQWNGGL